MKIKRVIILIIIFIIVFIVSMGMGYLLIKQILNKEAVEEANRKIKNNFNYEDNIDMEYIQDGEISCKVDYISLTDDKLEIVLNFLSNENISNFEGVSIPELTVLDENENQIFIETEDDRYHASIADGYETLGMNYTENIIKEKNIFRLKKKIEPKKIIIKFKKVILYNVNQGNPITKEFDGDWNFEIDV